MQPAAAERYGCGPLDVLVSAATAALRLKIAETLELYNAAWSGPRRHLRLDACEDDIAVPLGHGSYLACQRMHVDADGARLIATSHTGGTCTWDPVAARWTLIVPRRMDDLWVRTDIESLLSLVLTAGWRNEGWVPVHAGTVASAGRCAIVCAESGGGKTSLTAAFVHRGWQTLGDDKLLLRTDGLLAAGDPERGRSASAAPELRALVHTFNLHPRTREWFPEVGDLEQLPRYSEWTEKRKVHPATIWPDATRTRARPTHLIQLHRVAGRAPLRIVPLGASAVLSTLLRQTVIPSEPIVARAILGTIAATAPGLVGLRVEVAEDAYGDPGYIAPLAEAILA